MTDAMRSLAAVYGNYCKLMQLSETSLGQEGLGGRLLLVVPQSADSTRWDALVRAASIAGAATLLVEPDPAAARALVRDGVCDFLVNSLSEGLRILKNEVRLRQAVAVCVLGDAPALVEECVERGVQPDLVAAPEPLLVERGALLVPGKEGTQASAGDALVRWTAPVPAASALGRLDAMALEAIGGSDSRDGGLRQRWLARAPQYLGRAHAAEHSVGMREPEWARFRARIAVAIEVGELPAGTLVSQVAEPGP